MAKRHRQRTGGARHPRLSQRAAEPFIEVNCAAIPEELIESELFGHIKAASPAPRRQDRQFQKADGARCFSTKSAI